jgi:hypothetical protein
MLLRRLWASRMMNQGTGQRRYTGRDRHTYRMCIIVHPLSLVIHPTCLHRNAPPMPWYRALVQRLRLMEVQEPLLPPDMQSTGFQILRNMRMIISIQAIRHSQSLRLRLHNPQVKTDVKLPPGERIRFHFHTLSRKHRPVAQIHPFHPSAQILMLVRRGNIVVR